VAGKGGEKGLAMIVILPRKGWQLGWAFYFEPEGEKKAVSHCWSNIHASIEEERKRG